MKSDQNINLSTKHLRIFIRPLAITMVAVVGLGLLANILVDNPYAHRIIRVAINEKVNQYSNLNLDFKALTIRILPLEVNLYGFNLSVNDERGKTFDLARASQVHARLSLASLLLGRPKLSVFEMTDLQVKNTDFSKIKIFGDQKTGLADEPLAWPPKFPLPISQLVLQNASFNFIKMAATDRETSVRMGVEGLDMKCDFDDWDDVVVELDVSSFNLALDERQLFKRAKLSSDITLDEDIVSVDKLGLESLQLNTNGFIEGKLVASKNRFVGLDTKGQLDVEGDLKLLGQVLNISETKGATKGSVRVNSRIDWREQLDSEFDVAVEAKFSDAQIARFKIFDSEMKLDISNDKLSFTDITIVDKEHEYGNAQGEIWFDDNMSFKFEYSPRNLALTKLLEALTLKTDGIEAQLEADNYIISGQGAPFSLKTKGEIKLSEFYVPEIQGPESVSRSPRCVVDLDLFSNSEYLGFDGSSAKCFSNRIWPQLGAAFSEDSSDQYGDLSRVDISGSVAYSDNMHKDLIIKSKQFDLRLLSYFSGIEKSGSADINIAISQKNGNFYGSGKLDAKNVRITTVPLGDVSAFFTVDQKKVMVRNFVSKLDSENHIQVNNFRMGYEESLPFEADMMASAIPTAMIRPIIAQITSVDKQALFSVEFFTAKLEGELLKPFAYQGRMSALLRDGEVDESRIFDSLRFDVQATEELAKLKYFSYQIGDLVLNATGSQKKFGGGESSDSTPKFWADLGLNFSDQLKLNVGTTNRLIELSDKSEGKVESYRTNLHDVPFLGPLLQGMGIGGNVNINATLEGRPTKLSGTMQLGLNDFSIFKCELAPLQIEAFLHGQTVDTIIRHSGNALTGRFSLDFSNPKLPYKVYLKTTRLDVRAFAPGSFYTDPRNYAYLTSSLNLQGDITNWWNSKGNMNLSDIQLNYTGGFGSEDRRIEMNLVEPIEVIIDDKGWNIRDDKRIAMQSPYLNFSFGTDSNDPPEAVSVDFDGSGDLSGVVLLSEMIESSSGKIRFSGDIKGEVTNPNFSMNVFNDKVSGNNVSIGFVDLRPAFENIDLDISIAQKRLVLNRLTAIKGSGQINAVGQVNLDPNSTVDSQIDINFEDSKLVFPAPVVKLVEASVSGNLFVKNALPPYDISGNITIDRGRTVGEIDPRKEIIEALRQNDYSSSTAINPLVSLNVNVIADNSLIINNRNMQATLSSDLRITGTEIQPVVLGQVEVNKGKFIYKRDFNLTQGLITFDDPVKLDPKLDINAIAEAQNYRVFIAVSGRASEPVVDLSTDPATKDDGSAITKLDIITLLSTGSLPDSNRNDISSQTVAQTEALNIFAGQLEEPVEKLFDLAGQKVVREVYIDTYAISGGRPLARLNMPLNLGRNWDMIFRVDQESWKVSSEYALHENISILGSFDGRGESDVNEAGQTSTSDTGVDVRFRFSFP